MASPKQVDLIVTLWTKTGKLDRIWKEEREKNFATDYVMPTREKYTAWLREVIATASLDQTRQIIGQARAELGWQPETALASHTQRIFIADLEKRVYGSRRTLPG